MHTALRPRNEDQERHLRLIADSAAFRKAPALRSLLLYLWEHRGEPINEYLIATECLGRKPDFDPKLDATVRVHISRVRQKLKEFYDSEGASCPIRLSIPLGAHELEIRELELHSPRALKAPTHRLLAAATIILAVACVWLSWERIRLTSSDRGNVAERELPRFWRHFFANNKPTGLFLPTPVFFEWNDSTLKVRDIYVNDFADFEKSQLLAPLGARLGPPRLMQNYTAVSDTFAALKLAQYLQSKGITISVGATADLSIEQFGDRNIVLLGTATTSFHIRRLMTRTNFWARTGDSRIFYNRQPAPGEALRYEELRQSDTRRTVPGIIDVLPGTTPGTRVLILSGLSTSSLVSFLVSNPSLVLVDQAWHKAGSPNFYEVLVQAEIEGSSVLRAWPQSIRPIDETRW